MLSRAELKEAFDDDKLLKYTEKSASKGMIVWSAVWGVVLISAIIIIEALTANKGLIVWLWNKLFCRGCP